MKILIFGKGYLGNRMAESWPDTAISDARIDNKEAVLKDILEFKPDAIVNAAGKTGRPNVDWCETHQSETVQSNTIAPLMLAQICQEKNIYLLHLGSGCIFYGPSPDPTGWREYDFANPESFYSRSKYAADLLLSQFKNVGIARLRMPIDYVPSERNLINKLAGYSKIIDVQNSVTIVEDLLNVTHQMIEKRATGIFHVVNPGIMRHRDLMNLYRQYVDPTHACQWIAEEELVSQGLAAKKRSNVILQSTRLAEYGIHMRHIDIALRDTVSKYGARIDGIQTVNNEILRIDKATHDIQDSQNPQPFNFRKSRPKSMKGVILAGGRGTRLEPLTHITNKHLLPVFDRPMIMYPLNIMLEAGIKDILLVTGPDYAHQFMKLLGSGANNNCKLTYRIQDKAGGIAEALGLAKDFIGDNNCTAILGDNIFDQNIQTYIDEFQSGAMIFYKPVQDPERFGVVEIDAWNKVISIEEKPARPKTNLAQVGLYIYEPGVFDVIETLKPSVRDELEITDVNNYYLKHEKLEGRLITSFWSDAGTFQSMQRATEYFANKKLEK